QDMDGAEVAAHRRHQRHHALLPGLIEVVGPRPATAGDDGLRRRLGPGAVDVGDHHQRPRRREVAGDAVADALGGAGDDGQLAAEIEELPGIDGCCHGGVLGSCYGLSPKSGTTPPSPTMLAAASGIQQTGAEATQRNSDPPCPDPSTTPCWRTVSGSSTSPLWCSWWAGWWRSSPATCGAGGGSMASHFASHISLPSPCGLRWTGSALDAP